MLPPSASHNYCALCQGEDDVGSLCGPGHGGLNQLGVLALHLIPVLVLGTLQVILTMPHHHDYSVGFWQVVVHTFGSGCSHVKTSSVWPCSQL